jgi:hypothetical protein
MLDFLMIFLSAIAPDRLSIAQYSAVGTELFSIKR